MARKNGIDCGVAIYYTALNSYMPDWITHMADVRPGGHYLIANPMQASMLAELPPFPASVRVGTDGGLLSHLNVWENLILPLQYHAMDIRHIEVDAKLLFELCGEDLDQLMQQYPDDLSLYEKRLTGFIRALLLEPEILILDNILERLTQRDKDKVVLWEKVFHLRYPFRILLSLVQDEANPSGME